MAVKINGIEKGSVADKAGIRAGDILLELNGNEISDVLDYRFYQNDKRVDILYKTSEEKLLNITVEKEEYEELGLTFETYLMDKQHSCKNNCMFCFIDQLPKGMRESLYFKDDDSRMSFLFGNYITLTNITEHEIDRIIKLHISPVNVSVHTTNPELRVKMMGNRFAGESLEILWRLCDANINVNCQLVICPCINDGEELKRSLSDLIKYPSIQSIACVPVGLTGFREGLCELEGFDKKAAESVINIIEEYGQKTIKLYGERRVFPADEFFILAERQMPEPDYYGSFLQLENGVGMWSSLKMEAEEALEDIKPPKKRRKITAITGEAALPLILNIVDNAAKKWHNLECRVQAIKNNFFGGKITVTGLVTGTDIIAQLKNKDIGDELLVPATMLRSQKDMFLDSVTVNDVENELKVKVRIVDNDGWCLISALSGEQ